MFMSIAKATGPSVSDGIFIDEEHR